MFYKPVRRDTSEPPVVIQVFSILRVRKGACRESEDCQLPCHAKRFANRFLSVVRRQVLQHVGSYHRLEGTVGKGKLGSGANDWQQVPYWRTREFQVTAHNVMTTKISKAVGPGTHFKNGLAVCDMTPQDPEYGEVSCCPVKQWE